jgi:hypothetical protein
MELRSPAPATVPVTISPRFTPSREFETGLEVADVEGGSQHGPIRPLTAT